MPAGDGIHGGVLVVLAAITILYMPVAGTDIFTAAIGTVIIAVWKAGMPAVTVAIMVQGIQA